jgi:hypothetical protein
LLVGNIKAIEHNYSLLLNFDNIPKWIMPRFMSGTEVLEWIRNFKGDTFSEFHEYESMAECIEKDSSSLCWRIYPYIEGKTGVSIDVCESEEYGKILGELHYKFNEINSQIIESGKSGFMKAIDHFHDTSWYFSEYKKVYASLTDIDDKVKKCNNIIEKLGKSRLNSMDSLLELLNFPSDIIMTGMKNINDLVKSDELVNDMTFLQEIAYSEKGPNSLGENSAKTISNKYRDIHPSYVGRIDCNSTSNSDPGRSGSLTPFCKLYDGFYFSPDGEPCEYRFHFEKIKQDMNEKLGTHYSVNTAGKYRSFQEYKNFLESLDMEKAAKAKCEELAFIPLFQVAPITIVEKEESNDNELSDIVDYSTLNIEDSNTTEDSAETNDETNEEADAEE